MRLRFVCVKDVTSQWEAKASGVHLSISDSLGAYLQHHDINFTHLSSEALEGVLFCSDARDGVVAIACVRGHM